MVHCVASPARIANSTTRRLRTGSTPGMPRQTGHTLVFGGPPKAAEQRQKIFERVRSRLRARPPRTLHRGDAARGGRRLVRGAEGVGRGAEAVAGGAVGVGVRRRGGGGDRVSGGGRVLRRRQGKGEKDG